MAQKGLASEFDFAVAPEPLARAPERVERWARKPRARACAARWRLAERWKPILRTSLHGLVVISQRPWLILPPSRQGRTCRRQPQGICDRVRGCLCVERRERRGRKVVGRVRRKEISGVDDNKGFSPRPDRLDFLIIMLQSTPRPIHTTPSSALSTLAVAVYLHSIPLYTLLFLVASLICPSSPGLTALHRSASLGSPSPPHTATANIHNCSPLALNHPRTCPLAAHRTAGLPLNRILPL